MKQPSLFLTAALLAGAAFAGDVNVNDKAPLFEAVDQDGKSWALKDHLGGNYLVLYFYPAAMTGGCTKQACGYRDHLRTTDDPSFSVVGISGDAPENLRYFRQAEQLNFPLLSDPDGKIAASFGVPVRTGEKSITRTVDGSEVELTRAVTTARWTFIIAPDGSVVHRDTEVKAAEDVEKVLAYLKQQSG